MDILIVVGSESDLPLINHAEKILKEFEVSYELRITSAHRTPEATKQIIENAEKSGAKIIIAAAGFSAHLPGVCAAYSQLPVIGIPVDNSPLVGKDSLYSIVMMPPGVPVACMNIGDSGAKNAAHYAVKILALSDEKMREKVQEFRNQMRDKVLASDKKINPHL